MNLENELTNSGKKIIKRNMNYTKLNIKKNLKLMDDPAFHFNRTVKEYINNKLNNNNNSNMNIKNLRKIKTSNDLSNIFPKIKNKNISYNKDKNLSNISNNKQFFSKKKLNKIKKSNTKKKLIKSNSSNIFNLGHYIHIYNNKNKNININHKINKNKLMKKNSNNSTQKYVRYSGSTALSINDTNQLLEKNNSIFPYNNQLLSNHSTLDLNNLKTPVGKNTIKKYKYNSKFFTQNLKDKNNYSNSIKNKNKDKKFKNFNLVKNIKNLRKKDNKINTTGLDGIRPTKTIINNDKNSDNNRNEENKVQNNRNYITYIYKDNNEFSSNSNYNDIRFSYSISNNKNQNNSPKKNAKTINVEKGNKNIDINANLNGKIEMENNNIQQKDNDIEYLKKIELLENENKALKGEIDDSKNKLMFLENKINELLIGKNSIEKEECPQPTPYVKKYSIQTFQNFHPSPSTIINDKEVHIKTKENKNYIKSKNEKNNNKILLKNKSFLNKIQKYISHPLGNNNKKEKLISLKRNKSYQYLKNKDTKAKINVSKAFQNKNEKKKIMNKKNNFTENNNKKFKSNYSNFFTEGNIKK